MSGGQNDVRFGIIGCGAMPTTVHCPNLSVMPGAKMLAYCDLDESKARRLFDAYGGRYTTTDVERVLGDPDIDAVTVCIGPRAHPGMVQAAARAGKHVFVEKPLAAKLSDAIATVRVVEQAGIRFQHGTCNRLAPMVKVAKRMCPKPLYSYCQAASSVTHMPVHNIDLAVNLFHDSPVVRVYGSGGQMWHLDADKDLPADSYASVVTFADGSAFTYIQHANMVNPMLTKYHFQLFALDCCVYLAGRYKECHFIRGGKVERSWVFQGSDVDRGPFGYMGHYDEVEELVRCIRTGGQCTMTARQAAYVCAVENAILSSVETGCAVDFGQYLKDNGAAFLMEDR